jgi:hypothetical protein
MQSFTGGTSIGTQKKKLVIVPFKNKPQLPENFEQTTWYTFKKNEKIIYIRLYP